MILNCKCEHEYQDRVHGKGKRVHNLTARGLGRCTVCSNESGSTASDTRKKGKR